LDSGPFASLDSLSGTITIKADEGLAPGNYPITVFANKIDEPTVRNGQSFVISVLESNIPPHLSLSDHVVLSYGETLAFADFAVDLDQPPNRLSFQLVGNNVEGATLTRNSGRFQWTPPAGAAPGNYSFTIRVTDNGTPPQSSERTFIVELLPSLGLQIDRGYLEPFIHLVPIGLGPRTGILESSFDLIHWTEIKTIDGKAGNEAVTRTLNPKTPAEFYRLRIP
jgi:hypothetical protein